jgi:hypothetical protein
MVARATSTGNRLVAPQSRTDQFHEADPSSVVDGIDADAFYASAYDARLIAMIEHVATVEGPVRDDVLAKRIARAHGWARTGAKIRDRIMTLVRKRLPTTQEEAGLFIWAADADTTGFPAFRRPTGLEARPIDEIALPELTNLAREVLATGATGEAAVAAMARETGFQRLRAVNRERLERALALANFGDES